MRLEYPFTHFNGMLIKTLHMLHNPMWGYQWDALTSPNVKNVDFCNRIGADPFELRRLAKENNGNQNYNV